MPIVTVIKGIPGAPTMKGTRRQLAMMCMQELVGLWMDNYETFIAGKTFHFLAFPPGAYSPAKAGSSVTRQPSSAGTGVSAGPSR